MTANGKVRTTIIYAPKYSTAFAAPIFKKFTIARRQIPTSCAINFSQIYQMRKEGWKFISALPFQCNPLLSTPRPSKTSLSVTCSLSKPFLTPTRTLRATFPAQLTALDLETAAIPDGQYKQCSSSLRSFLHPPYYFLFLRHNHPQHAILLSPQSLFLPQPDAPHNTFLFLQA